MISTERIAKLNHLDVKKGKYVLYWMQSSQRTEYNLALNYAISEANKLDKPLVVFFGISEDFPEANLRHFYFMLEGLCETRKTLDEIGANTLFVKVPPQVGVVDLARHSCLIIVDKGYVRSLRDWYRYVTERVDCPLIQVEDNVVVPVGEASEKEEYSAATLRPKILRKTDRFLTDSETPHLNRSERVAPNLNYSSVNLDSFEAMISSLKIDASVGQSSYFQGGTKRAIKHLEYFLTNKLLKYNELKNDPTLDYLSNLSPYLHFGQISPIYITLRIITASVPEFVKEAFLEELIVRRELAINFVNYNQNYDSFAGLPNWAKKTLLTHKIDPREYTYSVDELENAKTHDPFWNAAQNEMRTTGKMHGYMRMYWGKKIIEWSKDPETAYSTALFLNNKYELDGRDPNGFAGVAWCFGKHDRPWKERPIFGFVRYMNANGLRRKFDAEKYVKKIQQL